MGFALLLIGAGLVGTWLLTRGADETPAPPGPEPGPLPTSLPAGASQVQQLLAAVPGIIATERDPARLEQLAAMLETAGQGATAAVVRQQAAALRTAAAAATQRPIDWTPPGATTPASAAQQAAASLQQILAAAATTPTPGSGPAEAPASPETAGIHPSRLLLARAAALRLDQNLRTSGGNERQRRRRYNQDLAKYFQALAGLTADGRYGGRTRGAMRFFGVNNPIPAFEARSASYTPNLETLRQPPPEPPPGVSTSGDIELAGDGDDDSAAGDVEIIAGLEPMQSPEMV